VLTRLLVTLVLLVGVLAGSGDAATGPPATQALAHLQAFDESLANLQVDLTAPIVVSTPAQTRQRLNGLASLIGETLPLVAKGVPGTALQQAKSVDQELATALKTQGAALLRSLASVKTTEGSLEAEVNKAAAVPGGSDPLALVGGATDFGTQPVGTQTPWTLTFENASKGPLNISSAQVSTGAFGLARDGCGGTTLAPLATCELDIVFAPTATGAASGTLTVNDSAPSSMGAQTFPLTGAGGASGSAQIVVKTGGSATPLAPGAAVLFPERTSLSSFATAGERVQALQLINVGTASATLDTVSVEGRDAGDFIVSPGCDNATLAPGSAAQSACVVSVEVRAARYTRPLNASLVVTGSHTGGLAPIPLGLTQADLRLGSLLASSAGGQMTYRFGVTNAGPDPAERTEIDAKVTSSAGPLRLVSSVPEGCAYSGGILTCAVGTLPAHATTLVTVAFATPKGAKVTNEAAVQSLDFDPTPTNDVKKL
jgi:Domain of unknown function DUF11/Abnormal spindle-like microcephaly-assoc'd, ASPM-SPD-2-Hydin